MLGNPWTIARVVWGEISLEFAQLGLIPAFEDVRRQSSEYLHGEICQISEWMCWLAKKNCVGGVLIFDPSGSLSLGCLDIGNLREAYRTEAALAGPLLGDM